MFEYIDVHGFTVLYGIISVLLVIGLSPINENKYENLVDISLIKLRKILMGSIVVYTLFLIAILGYYFKGTNIGIGEYISHKFHTYWLIILVTALTIYAIKFMYYWRVKVWLSDLKKRFVNEIQTEKLSSIIDTLCKYKALDYDPEDYIDLNKGIFFGLDPETKEPIYVDIETYQKTHKEVIGPSRSGKGVTACVIDYQKILLGWGLIYVDPKLDEFVSRVLKKACDKVGKNLIIIDLVESPKPTYAPFRGGLLTDIKARLKQILKVRRTGGAEDFYKGQEINLIDDALEETNRGVTQIYEYLKANRPAKQKEVATGIEDVFKALSKMEQINPKNGNVPHKAINKELIYPASEKHKHVGGISIARAIMEDQVIYVRGDTVDLDIRNITRLLLTEAIQEVKRLYPFRKNHFSITVDEGKFMMGEILSDAQATIAGFGCDMTLQYQALEDIETSIEKDIDMKALAQAVHVNSQIKVVHGGLSERTAEYVMVQSGTINKKITAMDKADVGKFGGEQWTGEKMVRDQQEEFFTTNDFLAMPSRVYALLIKNRLTQVVTSSPVNVESVDSYHKLLEKN